MRKNALRRDLKLSILDGFYYSLMVGMGETYLSAYALAVGLDVISTGLVTVGPMLIGASLQLLSPLGPYGMGSRKKWVVSCAFAQGLALLGLSLAASFESKSIALLWLLSSIYWAAGFSAGPPWNAWIGALVPKKVSVSFFSLRSRITHSGVFLGVVLGGYSLFLSPRETLHFSYAALFGVAGLFRLISSYLLSKKTSDVSVISPPQKRTAFAVGTALLRSDYRIILIYFFLLHLTVFISGPYYTPFMLDHLRIPYDKFMILTSYGFIARVVAYRLSAVWIRRWGIPSLLYAAVITIAVVPFCWAINQSFYWLLVIHIASGFAWAAHDLGMFLSILNRFEEDKRSDMLTAVNFLNSLGMVCGGLIGAQFLHPMPIEARYFEVFYFSGWMRFLPLILIPIVIPIAATKGTLKGLDLGRLFMRTIGVRFGGSLDKPILYTEEKKPLPQPPKDNE